VKKRKDRVRHLFAADLLRSEAPPTDPVAERQRALKAEELAREAIADAASQRIVRAALRPVKGILDAARRFLLRKYRAQQASGPPSAQARSLRAQENHAKWAEHAVAWVLERGERREFYAEPGRMSVLAQRLLGAWPDNLGKAPSRDWLRRKLTEQNVRERIQKALEK